MNCIIRKERSVDESMVKIKGRIFFRQYLLAKPTRLYQTLTLCINIIKTKLLLLQMEQINIQYKYLELSILPFKIVN